MFDCSHLKRNQVYSDPLKRLWPRCLSASATVAFSAASRIISSEYTYLSVRRFVIAIVFFVGYKLDITALLITMVYAFICAVIWSGERDLNPWPSLWESDALPTELPPLVGDRSVEQYFCVNWNG